jgi:biotin carboxyl carrier protein
MKRQVLVDAKPVDGAAGGDADVHQVEPGVYSVLLADGSSHEVRLSGSLAKVSGERRWLAVQVRDPREFSESNGARGVAGRGEIVAPMPGKVVRFLVEEGDTVEAGQGIVVVEAMKMQNEMPAPKAGKVTGVKAKAGDAVSAGQVLAAVE